MKRDLAWYPGMHSTMNHLYDVQSGTTLCGAKSKRKESNRGWGLNYWQNADCPRCKSKANELEEQEDDDDTCGGKYPYGWDSYETEIRP